MTHTANSSERRSRFAGLAHPRHDRSLWTLRTLLDSGSGIGRIAVGMHRQGFDLQLTQPKWKGTGDMAWRTSTTQIAWKSHAADG